MSEHACHYCGTTERELRPYGPKGADICHPCMKASPEREAEAKAQFYAQLDAAEKSGGVPAIGEDTGPRPFARGGRDA